MSTTVNPIPAPFHSLTPAINVIGGAAAIEFYQRAFGAVERYRMAMPVSNQFWGYRTGSVVDPFGLKWMIGTHVEDLTPEEIAARAKEFMSGAKGCAES